MVGLKPTAPATRAITALLTLLCSLVFSGCAGALLLPLEVSVLTNCPWTSTEWTIHEGFIGVSVTAVSSANDVAADTMRDAYIDVRRHAGEKMDW